jgi:hypothetical protein
MIIPEIHVENNVYIVYGVTSLRYGKNQRTSKVLREQCYYNIGYYICRRDREVWRDLLILMMRRGYSKVKICIHGKCREVEL